VTVPSVDGVLSPDDVRATAASIVRMQEPSGAIPWTPGEHTDVWNHIEGAMALLVAGERDAAEAAYAWVPTMQRDDGSWPLKIVESVVEDKRGDTNHAGYFAVGLWHHWLVCGDRGAIRRWWPSARDGLDWLITLQQPWGGISYTPEDDYCLLAGNSSIYHSLTAGLALAGLFDEDRPEWEAAAEKLAAALRGDRARFEDKSSFSMDWYYPVLGGAVRGDAGRELLGTRWDDFVIPGLGIRCVDTNPWVTGAESAELVMALDALGDPASRERALTIFRDIQHLRADDGSYWTGWVYDDPSYDNENPNVYWPHEQTTYTAAAVILAADALGERHGTCTPGSGIMRDLAR